MAIHPYTNRELGFIRYSKRAGVVDLTNYNSQLSGDSLGMGYSSKVRQEHLAGQHGEGYKLAALTLVRNGFRVAIKASKCD